MKKIISLFLTLLLTAAVFAVNVNAASYAPYSSYEYNAFGESVASPVGYTVVGEINAATLGTDKAFSGLADIVVKENKIFILDSGNSRILRLDTDYTLEKIYRDFTITAELAEAKGIDAADGTLSFTGAAGFTVGDDGRIYIADTLSDRILIANEACEITDVILRPDSALSDTNASFSPAAVEVDDRGWVYVASSSIAYGMMVFDGNGEFQYFYGANEVLSTTEAIIKFFRKTFMNLAQLEYVEQQTPVTITKMDFDDNGFVYTVSPYDDYESTTSTAGLIKKINYNGENILDSEVVFGDLEIFESKTWFVDVDVAADGLVNMLDGKNGRIFQYTDDGILVNVFGGNGDQIGCFSNPIAIESVGSTVLAVDSKKNVIYIYEPTEYGLAVQKAVRMMKSSDFEGSLETWNELLKLNSNSQLCYEGLGRAYEYSGDYASAMKYYRLADDRENYALAFKQERQNFIKNNIALIVFAVLLLIIAAVAVKRLLKKRHRVTEGAYSAAEQKYTIEFYALLHPLDAFAQFKTRGIASYRVSAIIIALLFAVKTAEFYFTGFAFANNRSSDFNLLTTLLVTVGLVVIFVISNWALCALIDGKGTFKDITATVAYSLIPYIVSQILIIVLSNLLVPSENVFIQIISVVGIVWTAAVLFLGMTAIHDFSVSKCVFSLLLTVFGMAVILFVIVLMFNLFQQMFNLAKSIYNELAFRA